MGNSSSNTLHESSDDQLNIENEIELIKASSYYLYAIIVTSNSESKGEQVLEYKSAPNLPEFAKYGKFIYKNVDVVQLKNLFSNNFGYDLLIENAKVPFRLRHPNILGFEKFKYHSGKFCLTTEYARPLSLCLSKLTCEEIYLGMFGVLESLIFVHNVVGLSHNNVDINSIFVSGDGSWKLSCFELAQPLKKMSQNMVIVLESIRNRTEDCNAVMFSPDRMDSYDVYYVGLMFTSILSQYCSEDGTATSFIETLEAKCLIPETKKRFTLEAIFNSDIFKNPYVEITIFLRNYSVKSLSEKQEFFRKLPNLLLALPEALVARRLVHKLLARIILVDPLSRPSLQLVLTPYSETNRPDSGECLLQASLFQRFVIPLLEKIFHIREYFVRTALLTAFPHYFHLFDKDMLRSVILPKIRLGLQSENANLVASTLHCMAYMVPLLGSEAVTGVPPTPLLFPEHGPKLTSLRPPNQAPGLSTVVNLLPDTTRHTEISSKSTSRNSSAVHDRRVGLSWNVLSGQSKHPERCDDSLSKPIALIAPTTSENHSNSESRPNRSIDSLELQKKESIPDDELVEDDGGWDSMWPDEDQEDFSNVEQAGTDVSAGYSHRETVAIPSQSENSSKKPPASAETDMIVDIKSIQVAASVDPVNSAIDDLFADMQPVFKPRTQILPDKSESNRPETVQHTSTTFIETEDAGDAWTEEWDDEDIA